MKKFVCLLMLSAAMTAAVSGTVYAEETTQQTAAAEQTQKAKPEKKAKRTADENGEKPARPEKGTKGEKPAKKPEKSDKASADTKKAARRNGKGKCGTGVKAKKTETSETTTA